MVGETNMAITVSLCLACFSVSCFLYLISHILSLSLSLSHTHTHTHTHTHSNRSNSGISQNRSVTTTGVSLFGKKKSDSSQIWECMIRLAREEKRREKKGREEKEEWSQKEEE